jgi:hypothetical protein
MPPDYYAESKMTALYPKPKTLPSVLLGLLLAGCGQAPPETQTTAYEEPWPAEHEVIFQEAEALKYSLEQHKLEEQRLREAGLPDNPPAPLQ